MRPHLLRGGLALFVIMIAAFLSKRFIIDVLLMGPPVARFPDQPHPVPYLAPAAGRRDALHQFDQAEHDQHGAGRTIQSAYAGIDGNRRRAGGSLSAVGVVAFRRACADRLRALQEPDVRVYVSLCFFTGLLFGYFLIVPLSINFLAGYQASPDIANMIDVKSYLSTVLTVSVACAIVFQLPLLIYFLARMGIVTGRVSA